MELVRTNKHEGFQKQISMFDSKKIKRLALGLAAVVFVLTSCDQTPNRVVNPKYIDYTIPARLRIALKGKPTHQDVEYHIDHINHRIYNTQYLPYGTKLDSAYLKMILSSNVKVDILNKTTNKTTNWTSADTGKIDISGGKLVLTMQISEKISKQYDLRILSYGYDPNKLTWKKTDKVLPKAFSDIKVIRHSDRQYLIGQVGRTSELYSISSYDPFVLAPEMASIPFGLMPHSIVVTRAGSAWGISDSGKLYQSEDLRTWTLVNAPTVKCTMVLFEPLKETSASGRMVVVGEENGKYSFYVAGRSTLTKGQLIPEGFPIRGAYVHDYMVSGVSSAVVLGGTQASGESVKNSFFTSDGISWAPTPYSSGKVKVPMSGGAFLSSSNGRRLFLIGGLYPSGTHHSPLKVSDDNGLTWTDLTKDKTLGDELIQRVNAAGVIETTADGDVMYVIGGTVNGTPTREIWRGWLDKSGGIINAF